MKVLLYFSASWCGQCKMFGPQLQDVCNRNNIPLQKINVDSDAELASRYNIRSIPTCIILDSSGMEANRISDVASEQEIVSKWQRN